MNRQEKDDMEEVSQILDSIRDFCIFIENPRIEAVFPSVFVLIECAAEKANNILKRSICEMEGGDSGSS